MASEELKTFLCSVDRRYLQYADVKHHGEFTSQPELGSADRIDLQALGIPKGAAGLIVAAARGTGDSFCCLSFLLSASAPLHCTPCLHLVVGLEDRATLHFQWSSNWQGHRCDSSNECS